MRYKVRLTVEESRCREGTVKTGDSFIVDELCPPLCMELWHAAYPYVFALGNGASLDEEEDRSLRFRVRCPDGGRVVLLGEREE